MDDALRSQLQLFLVAFATMALTVALYYCMLAFCCSPRQQPDSSDPDNPQHNLNPTVVLEPTHEYRKGENMEEGESLVCPVCLSEFEDGEEIRTLSECGHSFHISCIDMWLHSHSNCPVCRTHATPLLVTDSDSEPPA